MFKKVLILGLMIQLSIPTTSHADFDRQSPLGVSAHMTTVAGLMMTAIKGYSLLINNSGMIGSTLSLFTYACILQYHGSKAGHADHTNGGIKIEACQARNSELLPAAKDELVSIIMSEETFEKSALVETIFTELRAIPEFKDFTDRELAQVTLILDERLNLEAMGGFETDGIEMARD